MSLLDSFLHPEKGYKEGQNRLDQYYKESQGYLDPYARFAQNTHQDYVTAMKRLLDPQSLQNDWSKGYTESDSAKNAERMAQEHGLDAASSLGLMGSNTALNAIQGGTTRIGLDERQNYLNDLMQKYLAGAGIAGNIFNTGAGAAGTLSQNAMNMGQNSAQMAYGQQNAPGDLFGKLLGTGIGIASGGLSYKNPSGSGWSFGG